MFYLRGISTAERSMTFTPANPNFLAGGSADAARRRMLVLVIGRQEETRFLLKSLLELWNCDVTEASDGRSLTEAADGQKPDLVLLDSGIPFSISLGEIKAIRGQGATAQVPLVLISGFCRPEFRRAAISAGATDFLVKPLDFDALEQYVKSLTIENLAIFGRPGALV